MFGRVKNAIPRTRDLLSVKGYYLTDKKMSFAVTTHLGI